MIDDRDAPGADATIESIARALRPLPRVDDAAKARVLIAVAAERERARDAAARRVVVRRRIRAYAGVAGLMAASALAAVMLRSPSAPPAPSVATQAAAAGAAPTASAATLATGSEGALDASPQPVQLVFRAPTASRVRVVGDFNAWDGSKTPMTRDAESGLWSITLSLRPGRHVYAFLVDDSLWVRDPRAPAAPDADFGREGSVLLVGRPR